MIGDSDIGNFIERTWTKVPPAIVLEAVNKILELAKSDDSHSHFSLTTGQGGVVLNSPYEYRLFQLLPVLQELDKDKAEELLRDNAETKAKLAKYPQGMQSLIPPGQTHSYYSSGITDGDSPQAADSAARDQVQAQIQQRMDQVLAESQKDPTQALADALGLPVQGEHGSPRAEVLLRIAEGAVKKKPSVAKSALDEILKIQDQLTPAEIADLASLPKIYLDLGDDDGAKKAVKVLLKAAEKLYAHDIDADDPNKAFKGTWPSSDLWRKCVQAAARMSSAFAEEIISAIPDPEIAAAQKVAFASSLLGVSGEPVIVGDCRKTYSGYNFSN